jgi:Na+/glutamate symporter
MSRRHKGPDRLLRVLAIAALAWGAGYLIRRLVDTRTGADPVMFIVLFGCELFAGVVLASLMSYGLASTGPRAHSRRWAAPCTSCG